MTTKMTTMTKMIGKLRKNLFFGEWKYRNLLNSYSESCYGENIFFKINLPNMKAPYAFFRIIILNRELVVGLKHPRKTRYEMKKIYTGWQSTTTCDHTFSIVRKSYHLYRWGVLKKSNTIECIA